MFKSIAKTLCVLATAVTMNAQAPATKPLPKTVVTKDTPASLRREVKISEKRARAIALKEVPNGKVQSSELERENGNLIYSYDIKIAGKAGIDEITVNAITGAVVTHEHETPKAEKKEAATEKKK